MRKKIVVVGSANMDMVTNVKSFPRPGETMFGSAFGMFPGGKGANQAVCAAKLGGTVSFLGKVGDDILGRRLAENMMRQGVNLKHLMMDKRLSTGIALILVDARGQNQIIVVSGSNMNI